MKTYIIRDWHGEELGEVTLNESQRSRLPVGPLLLSQVPGRSELSVAVTADIFVYLG